MKKLLFFIALSMSFCASAAFAQRHKASPSPSINGTFRLYHPQKFRKFYNQVKIASLGKGKLKIGIDVVYPKLDEAGNPIVAAKREIEGIAILKGDTANFTSEEFASCSIMIKFLGQGIIAVLQESDPTDCGFGRRDMTTGNYRKISGARPKFKEDSATKIAESFTPKISDGAGRN